MSTAKTFFEWWVPYFSGCCIMKEMKEAYFSSIFLNNFFRYLEGSMVFREGYPGDSLVLY